MFNLLASFVFLNIVLQNMTAKELKLKLVINCRRRELMVWGTMQFAKWSSLICVFAWAKRWPSVMTV